MYEIVGRGIVTDDIEDLIRESLVSREPFRIIHRIKGDTCPRVVHVHYKRGCPYTRKVLELMQTLPYSVEYRMFPNDLPRMRELLGRYLGKSFFTFPQIFVRGKSIGGATEADVVLHASRHAATK